jgi:signal transduction histidine kinase
VVFLREALTERARLDMDRVVGSVAGYIRDEETHDLLGSAQLVASDVVVAHALVQGNGHDIRTRLMPLYAALSPDVLDVIDARGRVLVRMEDEPTAVGDIVRSRPSVRAAIERGQVVTALETDRPLGQTSTGYALRVTVPVTSDGHIVGAVVAGRLLDTHFATRIGASLNVQVNLIGGDQRTGTTLAGSPGQPATAVREPPEILARIATGRPSISVADEDGQPVISGLLPLRGADGRPAGAVEVLSPLGPLYDVVRTLSILLVALGGAVVILGTILALAVGRRLTQRLRLLEASAAAVATQTSVGLAPHVPRRADLVRGDDEVASLGRSFDAMVRALDERIAANARLLHDAQDKAVLEERQRLARELHDSVTQTLFSTTMHARAAQLALERSALDPSGPLGRSVGQLLALTQGALAEMRALIFELRPNALRDEGLVEALRKQAAAISARHGLTVEVEAAPDRLQLSQDEEEHLYRVALEALHNAVKHAGATRVGVRIEPRPDAGLSLEIHDDGAGFDNGAVAAGRLGLSMMAERARHIGATLTVHSTVGQGTSVCVTLPRQPPVQAAG